MVQLALYDLLSKLVAFPGPEFGAEIAHLAAVIGESRPKAIKKLELFKQSIPLDDLVALRELHTRTFDVQPITSLDIGYTLFGEDYKRGAILANLNAEHNKVKNDCGTELADHLTNVLRLIPRLTDEELRAELVRVLVGPAVQEMIREFGATRMQKKQELYERHHKTIIVTAEGDARTAYCHALEAIFEVLREDFALRVDLPMERDSKFASSVGVELGIEAMESAASWRTKSHSDERGA